MSKKVANLAKSQMLLKGNCVLMILSWLPTLIGQLLILNLVYNHKLNLINKTSLGYPMIYPILYLMTNKDSRRLFVKRLIKCQSKEKEMDEEFYNKLRIRKKYRRSIQVQPFVVATREI